jgi:hypothetical protein
VSGDRSPVSRLGGRSGLLALAATSLVGLLVVLHDDLEVGATVLVVSVGVLSAAVAGVVTRPHDDHHALMLVTVLFVPAFAIARWTDGVYDVIWPFAAVTGALAGRSLRARRRDAAGPDRGDHHTTQR